MKNYIEFTIHCLPEKMELLIAELADEGFEGFIEHENSFSAYIPVDEFNQNLFDDILFKYGVKSNDVPRSTIADKNWNEQWEAGYEPIIIDDNIAVIAPFHDLRRRFETELIIKPKNTFGTGHHETTQLMLKQMMKMDFKNKSVFDYGCGTGVLAIMASKNGASEILAIDIDQWSSDNVLENASLNNVDNIEFIQGDLSVVNAKKFDIILANINKNILLDSMRQLSQILKPSGQLLISGFYGSDLRDLEIAALSVGLKTEGSILLNNWCCARFNK